MFGYARVGTGYITFITTSRGVTKHQTGNRLQRYTLILSINLE